ncbi:LamG-like jellyroll fold domain-containing protein [Marinilabilia rubra]|uniref:Chitinase II/V-like catalytic domain-containing protein n=1 Tax=Marinilabilia rubra TaxID=2162893 RepID=A0A2U2BBC3_9BACT|nr:LamG-like jellyroll fold domain-containing protein [Marinilabilia rubra]PWE00374.1 hypothetical protein DDZ16_05390 [Marinilabilia rubra]
MVRILMSLFFLMPALAFAQVNNYALKLQAEGTANFYGIPEINEQSSYTLQFWVNPSEWTSGASVFSRGADSEKFAAELGTLNEIVFTAGNQQLNVSSNSLDANQWSQVTLVNNAGNIDIYINNELVTSLVNDFVIPQSNSDFVLGNNGFSGRIDEFRIWTVAVENPFFHLWRNTVNKHHPNWGQLLVYYKFDQNQCDNIVDYKFHHHGVFSGIYTEREEVTDNPDFKYRKSVAYSNFSRWADRQIDADKYLLANDLILLDISVTPDGTASLPHPYSQGTVNKAGYMDEYLGHTGVLSLNGAGAGMEIGTEVLNPSDRYSFSTWIYLEEWTEGAFIFRKEKSIDQGFSIRLGDVERNTIIIRVNGVEYIRPFNMKLKEWIHLGIAAYSTTNYQVFQTSFNGETTYAVNPDVDVHDYQLTGLENTTAYIGENLNAKLDETVIWKDFRSSAQMAAAMIHTPMPSTTEKVEAVTLRTTDAYYSYDDPANVGHDLYSNLHFIDLMRQHYEGHRGFMIRGAVHSFDGWESRFADPAFRTQFASTLADVSQVFDGVDLDFEWCYSGTCWDNYGKVIQEVEAALPADKILTVTPHYVSYSLPLQYMEHVDYFPFQIYGPSKTVFQWDTYVDGYNRFVNHGYPTEKIVLSYATTTSVAYDVNTDERLSVPPIGVRNDLLENGYTPEMNSAIDGNGYRRYITGYNQVIDRCEFIQDYDLGGIMYWDMGNDVKTSHPFSLVKAASYALNSNVDTLVTQVDVFPTSINNTPVPTGSVKVFPNPAKDTVHISIPSSFSLSTVRFFNSEGRLVKVFNQPLNELNVRDLTPGIYYLQADSEKGESYTSKVIIH